MLTATLFTDRKLITDPGTGGCLLATNSKRCATFLFSILVQSMVGEDPRTHLFPSLARAVSLVDYQSTLRKKKLKAYDK